MATKLKNLKIKRVALVDEGANPDAHIKFAKNKDGNEPMVNLDGRMTTEEAIGFFERLAAVAKRVFMPGDGIDKAAYTFAETEEKRNYEKVMSDEVYPTMWAFMDSVESILNDHEKSDDEKASLLKRSVSEFSETFSACAGAWAKAEAANAGIEKDTEALSKMRDSITALIEKTADGDDQPGDGGGSEVDGDDDDKDGDEPPVKKGVTDMEFDTSKMTPEEKAQFDDFAKRFGVADPAPAGAQAAQPAAAPTAAPAPAGDDGVSKNLTLPPEVQAEIEALRKFRTDTEERELNEVAKRYTIIGRKPEELLPVLKALKATGGDAYDQFIAGLDAAVKAVDDSGMFTEVGKRGAGSSNTDDAWGKIEAAAHEIQKSKPDMRWPDAVDAACNAHPELVDEYEKSRR